MMNTANEVINDSPEFSYHLLRGALQMFKKSISELSDSQYQQAKLMADKTYALESVVLSTPEARDIIVTESAIISAVEEVVNRYDNREFYIQDLKNNGLDEDVLRSALHRELLFNAVMDSVTESLAEVSDVDINIFYQLHKERFIKPEERKVRHILITVNEDFAENNSEAAYNRATSIAKELNKKSSRFNALAKKYSECPTAIEGGLLGEVVQGTLYPELDSELFNMRAGDISNVIETEMGFHVIYCEKINQSTTMPLSRAKAQIKNLLQERHKKICQKAWLDKAQKEKGT